LAARDYLNIIKEEQVLDWTFFSPAVEMHQGTSGTRKGTYRTGLENPVFDANGRSIISVEDTAVAIVDELEKPKHIQQRFTAAY
jgi:putative NADH-flavin reductase